MATDLLEVLNIFTVLLLYVRHKTGVALFQWNFVGFDFNKQVFKDDSSIEVAIRADLLGEAEDSV